MSAQQYLVTGWDPTSGDPNACITRAQLLQMIQAVKPYLGNGIGMVVKSDSAPDVVTYPELADFIWLKSVAGVLNGEFYYYNGTSWTLLSLVDGSLITDHTITLAKISMAGATALYIMQADGTATNIVWVSLINAIVNGTLPVAKLIGTGVGVNGVLVSQSGTNSFVTPAVMAGLIPAGTIALTQLAVGGAGNFVVVSETGVNQYITFDTFVGLLTDGAIAQAKIAISGGGAGQARRINVGATAWEWFTPSAVQTALTAQAMPAGFGTLTFAHTLGVMPSQVRVIIQLISGQTDLNYTSAQELAFTSLFGGNGADQQVPYMVKVTTTDVKVTFSNNTAYILDNTTDVYSALTRAKWNVKVYVGA